ncbi:MAG: OmpH family outer membrane protein [Pyrinomonadaceae bacterium]
MKLIVTVTVAVLFTALTVFAVNTPRSEEAVSPPAQGAGAIPEGKVVVVDSEEFGNPKTGIQRVIAAFGTVEREFRPRRDEIQQLTQRYEQTLKDLGALGRVADEKALAAKRDEVETLKRSIERKQQDGQQALDKRVKELTNPIYADLSKALQAFALKRGVSVILDLSKLRGGMIVINKQVDITSAFIAEYNSRPAGSTPAPGNR